MAFLISKFTNAIDYIFSQSISPPAQSPNFLYIDSVQDSPWYIALSKGNDNGVFIDAPQVQMAITQAKRNANVGSGNNISVGNGNKSNVVNAFHFEVPEGKTLSEAINELSNVNFNRMLNTTSNTNMENYAKRVNMFKMTKKGRAQQIYARAKTSRQKRNVEVVFNAPYANQNTTVATNNILIKAMQDELKIVCEISKKYMDAGENASNLKIPQFEQASNMHLYPELPLFLTFCNDFKTQIKQNLPISEEIRKKYIDIFENNWSVGKTFTTRGRTSFKNPIEIMLTYFKLFDFFFNYLSLFKIPISSPFEIEGVMDIFTKEPTVEDLKEDMYLKEKIALIKKVVIYYVNTVSAMAFQSELEGFNSIQLQEFANSVLGYVVKKDVKQVIQNKLLQALHRESEKRIHSMADEINNELQDMTDSESGIKTYHENLEKAKSLAEELKTPQLTTVEKLAKHLDLQKTLKFLDVDPLPYDINSRSYFEQLDLKLRFMANLKTKVEAEIEMVSRYIAAGRTLYNMISKYAQGNTLGAAYEGATLAWYGRAPAKDILNKYKRLSGTSATPSSPTPTSNLLKKVQQSKITTLSNIQSRDIYVNIEINNSDSQDYKHGTKEFKSSLSSLNQRGQVIFENDKYYVLFININDKGKVVQAKRALPFPVSVKKILKDGEYKELPMNMVVKHQITIKAGDEVTLKKMAGNVASQYLTSGKLQMSEKQKLFVPWASISYNAQLHIDKDNEVFVWYLNEQSTHVPLYIKDSGWKIE